MTGGFTVVFWDEAHTLAYEQLQSPGKIIVEDFTTLNQHSEMLRELKERKRGASYRDKGWWNKIPHKRGRAKR